MSSPDTPALPKTPPIAEAIDVEASADLEQSLLKRRKGSSEAYLTRGQRKPTLLKNLGVPVEK